MTFKKYTFFWLLLSLLFLGSRINGSSIDSMYYLEAPHSFNLATINNACWICDVFDDVVSGIGNIFTGGLWKDNWGYYDENGRQRQGPYTVFDNNPKRDIYEDQVKPLRILILSDSITNRLYRLIVDQATSNLTNYCVTENELCAVAKTAKAAAFVYAIGIGFNGTVAYQMGASDPNRIAFRFKAQTIINNASPPGFIFLSGIVNPLTAFIEMESFFYRGQEFSQLVSAFDLIKWSHFIDPELPNLQSDQLVRTMAEKLKDNFVTPFCDNARRGAFMFTNNNYGLLAASALGLASVCLNDYGGYFYNKDAWPQRWADLAHYHINNNMWKSSIGKPISKGNGLYGFAEGPHYFKTSFECMLPYFRAQQNSITIE